MTPVEILRKILIFFIRLKLYATLIVWYLAVITKDHLVISGDLSLLQQNDYTVEFHHISLDYFDRKFLKSIELKLQQNDYTVEFHHISLDYFDRKFLKSIELKNVKPNRTHKAFAAAFDLITDIEDSDRYKVNVKGFRILSNGLDHLIGQFNVGVCQIIRKNTFGFEQIIKTGNITPCPIKKGYYYANNFIVDEKRMPPYLPEGRYKVITAIVDGNTPITITSLFMDIIYKIKN
ncbi:Protein of unknown function (DUF1091) [Popillia japonica]|uniref:Uncharacterized protein n=1 Tax=Popillia japonica TaxID=7064 RepID=A0AAW1IUF3_POPJA